MNYKPISFEKFKKEALSDPDFKQAYDDLEEEFNLMAEMIKARKKSQKTQQEVADTMHTSQAVVARIENPKGFTKHSPTLVTLKKYAHAVGCKLQIKLVPDSKCHHYGI